MDSTSFIEKLLDECGGVGYGIIILFLLASLLFFRRFIYLHRIKIDSDGFLLGIKNKLNDSRKTIEAIAICEDTRGPVASVVRAILSRDSKDEAALRRAADEAAIVEVPRLQKGSRIISGISQLLPLLGLLGTVLSLRSFFGEIAGSSNVVTLGVEQVSGDIRTALVTTAMGLAGGIIVHFYNLVLQESCSNIVEEMERTAVELINFLVESPELADRMNRRILALDKEEEIK